MMQLFDHFAPQLEALLLLIIQIIDTRQRSRKLSYWTLKRLSLWIHNLFSLTFPPSSLLKFLYSLTFPPSSLLNSSFLFQNLISLHIVCNTMLHQRNEPLEPYYHAWEWVSVRNNLGVKLLNEVDRKVCAFTGKYGPLEKAHILPISNAYTKALEFWMTELKLFPREPKDIQRAKVHQRNLVHMNLDLCYCMQPTRPNFLFMPTRETLFALIKHFEAGLHAASQSESSFLGFHSGNLLSSWPHYIVNNKAYEYEGWHISTADFEMDLTYHLTFKVIDNNEKRTYFSRDDSIETNPLQFQPELPSVWLVLSPFNVLLNTWKALYRIRETLHLSPEHNERLFVLGEYALELGKYLFFFYSPSFGNSSRNSSY